MRTRGKVYGKLVAGAGTMAAALGGAGALASRLAERDSKVLNAIGLLLTHFGSTLDDVAELGAEKLKEANDDALAKQENLRATLTGFQMDLDKGDKEQILLRSRR